MHPNTILRLSTLLPSDLAPSDDALHINVPSWAFQPDEWSIAFQRGLRTLDLDGKRVWEVGCGTGLNLVQLSIWFPNALLIASDYDPRCTELTSTNLGSTVGLNTARHELLFGQWDLVTSVATSCADVEAVDCIVACIPQVPKEHVGNGDGDDRAHYYEPGRYGEAHWHTLGLGLNDALLERAKQVLAPGGRVVLNLGGRPGKNVLLAMFNKRGYDAHVLHEEMIPQHTGTSLESLVALELAGQAEFEFFGDSDGRMRITARQAEALRVRGELVFHKIYVICGTLRH